MTAFYIVISVIALLMLLALIPIDCVIEFSYNNKENRGAVIIKYLFFKFKLFPNEREAEEAVEDAEKEDTPKEKNDVFGLIRFGKTVYGDLKQEILRLIRYFFARVIRIKELNISSKFGLGDPMYTGIASGAVNAAVYNAVSALDRHIQLDKWKVSLDPDFDNACLSAGVYAKIRTRIVYVIRLGIMAAVLLIRIRKLNRRMKKNG